MLNALSRSTRCVRAGFLRGAGLMALTTALWAGPGAAGGVFLNGVNIDGVVDQKFENCTVTIDAQGNVLIQAKGYRVEPVSADDAEKPAATAKLTRRYFLVVENSAPGKVQYDVDLFVNSVWVKRLDNASSQDVSEITKHFRAGENKVSIVATKNVADGRKSEDAAHAIKLLVGEGTMSADQVVIEKPLVQMTRTAAETKSHTEEFKVTAR